METWANCTRKQDVLYEDTRRKLLVLVKAAFEKDVEAIELTSDDVRAIQDIATRQSILYIIIVGLKNLGYSNLVTDSMSRYEPKAVYDYVQRNESLKSIAKSLETAHISFVPLKGVDICNLYPNPSMRTSSDIDILVKEKDLKKSIKAIESGTDFKFRQRTHHDAQFLNKRVHLELHFSLLANIKMMDDVLGRAWDYVVPVAENRSQFTPEYNIFYTVAHAAKHFIQEGGIGIRPLLDLWLLKSKTAYAEKELEELFREAGLLGFYNTCCGLLDVWFDSKPYSDVDKELEALVFSGGVFGSEYTKVMSRKRKNKGAKYVFSRVFRSSDDIKEFFPICEKHPFLIPFYQVVRWTRLINPSKRREVASELKQARNLEQSEIERYDKLLKSMDL